MADVKDSILRAVGQMTQFDLFELFESVRDLPHYESKDGLGRDGYFFDLDMWPEDRIAAFWHSIQARRKRINDVWGSEMRRTEILGTLTVEFGGKRKYGLADPDISNSRPRKRFMSEDEVELPPALKIPREPTLKSFMKRKEKDRKKPAKSKEPKKAATKPARTKGKGKGKAAPEEESDEDESEEDDIAIPTQISDDDEDDWMNDPRFKEMDDDEDGNSSDSMGGLF